MEKNSTKLLILIFKFQKTKVRFIMILEFFICLMLELLELLLNFYSLGITFFFGIFYLKLLVIFSIVYIFFLNFQYFP
jgi:hypothetical protein